MGSESKKLEEEEAFKGPQFSPRLYKQRYNKAIQVFEEYGTKIKKLVDFGCAECRFLRRCRTGLPEVGCLVGVDVDGTLLKEVGEDAMIGDEEYLEIYFQRRRAVQLWAKLFAGDLTIVDGRLADVDAISCIELLEHLEAEPLGLVAEALFGGYRPRVAFVSTPNREFNVLFDMSHRQFRHPDHKFEWDRSQFKQWCEEVVCRFPTYRVEIGGLGEAPDGEDIGFCTQYAIFTMDPVVYKSLYPEKLQAAQTAQNKPYKLVMEIEFPYDHLARVGPQLGYWSSVCLHRIFADAPADFPESIIGYQKGVYIPLETLVKQPEIKRLCPDPADLGAFLCTNNWKLDFETGAVFHVIEDLPSSSSNSEDDEQEAEEEEVEDDRPRGFAAFPKQNWNQT